MLIQTISGLGEGVANTVGQLQSIRADGQGAVIVSEYQPRYSEIAYRKRVYTARAALQATSLVGTAMVGLQLWNSSTNLNLVVTKLGSNVVATSATQTGVVLAASTNQNAAPTSATAVTVFSGFVGGPAGAGLAYSAGTYVTAPIARLDVLHNTAAIAATGEDPGAYLDLEGSIIIPPQCWVCFAAVGAAGAASSNNHWIQWVELPV